MIEDWKALKHYIFVHILFELTLILKNIPPEDMTHLCNISLEYYVLTHLVIARFTYIHQDLDHAVSQLIEFVLVLNLFEKADAFLTVGILVQLDSGILHLVDTDDIVADGINVAH